MYIRKVEQQNEPKALSASRSGSAAAKGPQKLSEKDARAPERYLSKEICTVFIVRIVMIWSIHFIMIVLTLFYTKCDEKIIHKMALFFFFVS